MQATARSGQSTGTPALLEVEGLSKHFAVKRGLLGNALSSVYAVDGISFSVCAGETLGIVGESGCGKSTTARLLMGLIAPTSGTVRFDGELVGSRALPLKEFHRQVQMVFQDSYASLNPRLTVEDSIAFGPTVHGVSARQANERARSLLERVGIDPLRYAGRFPHELSGGQRQRVNIARALALHPRILILDEAVSALDKSIEAQVLNLLLDLKQEFGLTYLFISHDLEVVRFMASRVLVMYLGKIAELGPTERLYRDCRHPYTKALLGSMLSMDPDERTQSAPLAGDPPNPIDPPPGCRFSTRCAHAEAICSRVEPLPHDMEATAQGAHCVACHMVIGGSGHSRSSQAPEAKT
jgi:peptide/nickel transport system ATP-binding protein